MMQDLVIKLEMDQTLLGGGGGQAYGSAVASLFSKLEIFKVRNVQQFKPQRCKYSFISISVSE